MGSCATYEEAQPAVDFLALEDFPAEDATIVGVDLMCRAGTGRLTWGRADERCVVAHSSSWYACDRPMVAPGAWQPTRLLLVLRSSWAAQSAV
ncbi:general stress protein [Lentzea atacamensis]|uniref:general stress protein n=1 Tax=Lentzea atacamensis TaxID=531938 RepID=UPI002D7772E3|nr:hypothetical protein [Lentzea atacamensis]